MHTYFVMVQGSLIYQKVHLNKYWRLFIESWVWWHGFSVATMLVKTNWWQAKDFKIQKSFCNIIKNDSNFQHPF